MILVCALICAGQLYGMESQPSYETLLPELKQEIINTALATTKNIDESISMVKQLSIVHNVRYDNLKDFTKLVHLLADKFDKSTADIASKFIASKFNTPIAHTYLNLGKNLLIFAGDRRPFRRIKMIELIDQGADVNFSTGIVRPLKTALKSYNFDVVKILLNFGAKITMDDLDEAKSITSSHVDKARETSQLIEETWKKQQRK